MSAASPDHEALKGKLDSLKLRQDNQFHLRLYRSLSWLKRASDERGDHAKFVFLWIAFNAAYATEQDQFRDSRLEAAFDYVEKLVRLDCRRMCKCVGADLHSQVVDLMDNRFVFRRFWNSPDDTKAREKFESARQETRSLVEAIAAMGDDTHLNGSVYAAASKLLRCVFDRLYVLRNQLMHGSATEGGFISMRQAESGTRILEVLVPVFLDIMLNNPDAKWGNVPYPVSEENRRRWRSGGS